ncbi:hypothetical protein ABN763_01015 [Spongiivirga sp. MCCC 1A20706]|uniref:hypothetical protein n=1 Tax=Spongiivirga sp. MCCC 1A20706 TaxID=3160963 RepID=UPI003977C76D
MKKTFGLLIGFVLGSALMLAQGKNSYESPDFDELTEEHQTIAIIPFLTSLNLEDDIKADQLEKLEEQEGYEAQNALESYFLRRNNKRKAFVVDFQNVGDTNRILLDNNITYNDLDIYSPQELCKILKVDGIVSGKLILSALISEGIDESFDLIAFLSGKSDFGKIIIKTSDGNTGRLLWRYEQTITRKTGKNTFAIIEKMMRKASRKFPYDKERIRKRKK